MKNYLPLAQVKKSVRMTVLDFWSFEFVSDFEIRISDL
jgi:hypothetical protein